MRGIGRVSISGSQCGLVNIYYHQSTVSKHVQHSLDYLMFCYIYHLIKGYYLVIKISIASFCQSSPLHILISLLLSNNCKSPLVILCFLTLSCLEISLTKVVWNFDTFGNNFLINQKFIKYLKENVGWIFINLSASKFFQKFYLLERYQRNSQAVLGSTSIMG